MKKVPLLSSKTYHNLMYGAKRNGAGKRLQEVLSAPAFLFKESYTTKSGQIKNRYIHNPDSFVIKTIIH